MSESEKILLGVAMVAIFITVMLIQDYHWKSRTPAEKEEYRKDVYSRALDHRESILREREEELYSLALGSLRFFE